MSKSSIMGLLKGIQNIGISGDTEIKVLSAVDCIESENSLFIIGTGIDENENIVLNDSFSLDLNIINNITSFCGIIELHTTRGTLVLEGF